MHMCQISLFLYDWNGLPHPPRGETVDNTGMAVAPSRQLLTLLNSVAPAKSTISILNSEIPPEEPGTTGVVQKQHQGIPSPQLSSGGPKATAASQADAGGEDMSSNAGSSEGEGDSMLPVERYHEAQAVPSLGFRV